MKRVNNVRPTIHIVKAYEELNKKYLIAIAALNKIGILGMSGEAYTKEFTERVRGVVSTTLRELDE